MVRHRSPGLVLAMVAGVMLAALASVVLLAPVAAQAPVGGSVPIVLSASGGSPLIGTEPMSRVIPYPYPWPSQPISRGIIVVPVPYWCNWPTPVPPPLPPGAPTRVPPTPVPSPTPGGMASAQTYTVCPRLASRVPMAVQQHALAEPWTIYGYNMRLNPNTPYHPLWNPYRTQLGLLNPNLEYHACNPVVWKAACP